MVFVGYGIRVNFSLLENLAGPEKVVRLNELRDYTNNGTIMDLVKKICGNEALSLIFVKQTWSRLLLFAKKVVGWPTIMNSAQWKLYILVLLVVSWEITRQVVLSIHTRHHWTWYDITSYHSISLHITSHHITSYYFTSHYITFHHIPSHYLTPHHISLHHSVSNKITSQHVAAHHIMSSPHITWNHVKSHQIISQHIMTHHIAF